MKTTREIKFRGKATEAYETSTDGVEKGDWVYGHYYFCRQRMSGIIVTTLSAESGGVGSGIVQVEIEVDYKTVGQFTGLKDRNGKEIYEGDIVTSEVWTPEFHVVQFNRGGFCFGPPGAHHLHDAKYLKTFKVIGNRFENPELLTQTQDEN